MPGVIDPADLIDSTEVAELIGLRRAGSVSLYRSRYADFPEPVVVKGSGMCMLWLRQDVSAWAKATGRAT